MVPPHQGEGWVPTLTFVRRFWVVAQILINTINPPFNCKGPPFIFSHHRTMWKFNRIISLHGSTLSRKNNRKWEQYVSGVYFHSTHTWHRASESKCEVKGWGWKSMKEVQERWMDEGFSSKLQIYLLNLPRDLSRKSNGVAAFLKFLKIYRKI